MIIFIKNPISITAELERPDKDLFLNCDINDGYYRHNLLF